MKSAMASGAEQHTRFYAANGGKVTRELVLRRDDFRSVYALEQLVMDQLGIEGKCSALGEDPDDEVILVVTAYTVKKGK